MNHFAPQQMVVVKQSGGCLKVFLIVSAVITVLGIGLVVLFAVILGKAAESVVKETAVAAVSDYSVNLDTCSADGIGDAKASGTIVNRSDKRQGFSVTVRFTTPEDVLISEDTTFIDTLDIGQSGTWTVASFDKAVTGLRCNVARVNYTIFDTES